MAKLLIVSSPELSIAEKVDKNPVHTGLNPDNVKKIKSRTVSEPTHSYCAIALFPSWDRKLDGNLHHSRIITNTAKKRK